MHKVELEFKRIQTYLFASPRLRAMLGANASLGQTIRVELPRLAHTRGAKARSDVVDRLPRLAAHDPLTPATTQNALLADDPAQLYRECGVLVRDGGHFIATFPNPTSARNFIDAAIAHVSERLPGILIDVRIDGEKENRRTLHGEALFQHPAFQVSQYLGNRPASLRDKNEGRFLSEEERRLEERGRAFRQDPSDLIGLLEKTRIIPCAEEAPTMLSDLTEADGDYLALIHADGNSIGRRYQAWRRQAPPNLQDDLLTEAHGEVFFHSMRVAVRRALCEALTTVFGEIPQRYQLLMLGGDDLLLACAARHALPFVHAYAQALASHPLCDGEPLTIGAGVAIAKETFPFHRLHAIAETLADSAKRRHRHRPEHGSVIDWHITTASWVDDPIAERRGDSLGADTVLSDKPYTLSELDHLIKATHQLLRSPGLARSQLRSLVETLRRGPTLAELAWLELPPASKAPLCAALECLRCQGLWRTPTPEGKRLTPLPDLVELFELMRPPTAAAPSEEERRP